MLLIPSIPDMRDWSRAQKKAGRRIGFVPTMGFLHEGHLSLIRKAREQAEQVVVSIFVNPAQFGPDEDLDAYPRDFGRDEALCRQEGADAVFYPAAKDMYPSDASVFVNEEKLSKNLCGASRPGHFRGVLTVVAKLFNIVQPDTAVFGRKDAQQLRLMEQMVRDLNIPVHILSAPIVREPDGLAMSSRNAYLTGTGRRDALCLRRALDAAESLAAAGARTSAELLDVMREEITKTPSARIDYIDVADWQTLQPVEIITGQTLVALAVFIGKTRLIDNTILNDSGAPFQDTGDCFMA